MTPALLLTIGLALAFDFINGFHDAANSIATVVSTRVLSPRAAVAWAAAFNFVAFLVFPMHVSAAIAKGIAPEAVTQNVILATLLGAIVWNLMTWWFGLPSSSSHALMGGFAGAALSHTPDFAVLDHGVFGKTLLFIFVAPALGMMLAFLLFKLVRVIFRASRPGRVDRFFRRGQFLSAALYSLGHGGNDAQKTMGIITALLISAGLQEQSAHIQPQLWVVLLCQAAMGFGTLSGGWRIVRTMGMRITKLKPVGGFCAETGGAVTLALAIFLGVPVSTTHTITGAIVGVGASEQRARAVRWGVAGRIVWAWVLTIPAAAAVASLSYVLVRALTGVPTPPASATRISGRCAWFSTCAMPSASSSESPSTTPAVEMIVTRPPARAPSSSASASKLLPSEIGARSAATSRWRRRVRATRSSRTRSVKSAPSERCRYSSAVATDTLMRTRETRNNLPRRPSFTVAARSGCLRSDSRHRVRSRCSHERHRSSHEDV